MGQYPSGTENSPTNDESTQSYSDGGRKEIIRVDTATCVVFVFAFFAVIIDQWVGEVVSLIRQKDLLNSAFL